MKNPDVNSLKKKLWKIFSEYIRRRDLGKCFTCGNIIDWKEANAGHYIHGTYTEIYFDEFNVNCQCVHCNKWNYGNSGVYAENIIEKYGLKKLKWLKSKRDTIKRWKIDELQELIEKYKIKISKL